MNNLGIDYGTKNIGLAYSVSGIITPLPPIPNDSQAITKIAQIVAEFNISKIYVGLSVGRVAVLTLKFVKSLKAMLELPIETVEEAVSTIEATQIYNQNRNSGKLLKKKIDSVSAAVILSRVIN